MTPTPTGAVYLVHFEGCLGDPTNPKGGASHYLGWADDVDARLAEHRAGRGERILAACVERGIAFEVVATWAGVERSLERRMKRQHNAWRYCPRCRDNRCVQAGADAPGAPADAKPGPA